VADGTRQQPMRPAALYSLALVRAYRGQVPDARELAGEALALCDRTGNVPVSTMAIAVLDLARSFHAAPAGTGQVARTPMGAGNSCAMPRPARRRGRRFQGAQPACEQSLILHEQTADAVRAGTNPARQREDRAAGQKQGCSSLIRAMGIFERLGHGCGRPRPNGNSPRSPRAPARAASHTPSAKSPRSSPRARPIVGSPASCS
jgi:hypothetical protein